MSLTGIPPNNPDDVCVVLTTPIDIDIGDMNCPPTFYKGHIYIHLAPGKTKSVTTSSGSCSTDNYDDNVGTIHYEIDGHSPEDGAQIIIPSGTHLFIEYGIQSLF